MESSSIEYLVINKAESTTGGIRFAMEIGHELCKKTLIEASEFIWKLLDLKSSTNRKNVETISLIIEEIDGVAYTDDNEIHFSTSYVENYTNDLKSEVIGVLYHEMVHVWQWDGNGETPGWLIEGIADFIRLKADYAPSHWVQKGQGEKWDHGYDVTAMFLEYCDDMRSGFVAELNKKMKSGYDDEFFVDLLGKPVDQLWSDYKAKYA